MRTVILLLAAIILVGVAAILFYANKSSLDEYNSVASANFSAACINVVRDTDEKRLHIFATVPVTSTVTNVGGWSIDVVSNAQIIAKHKKLAGAYHNHHNGLVLNFAAVQTLEGDRDLGLCLIRTLARVNPDFEWSGSGSRNRTIQQILQGIEANDGSMKDFLQTEKVQWEWRTKEYGMPKNAPEAAAVPGGKTAPEGKR